MMACPGNQPPNMALQRTRRPRCRSGRSLRSLGSPLNARPLAGARNMVGRPALALGFLLALTGCEPQDCSRVTQAHASIKPGMTFVEAVTSSEAAQLPDLEWIVRSEEPDLPQFEISKQPYRIRLYSRPRQAGPVQASGRVQPKDLILDPPYQESGYSSRSDFLQALSAQPVSLAQNRTVSVTMRCLRGGIDMEVFTIRFGPGGTVERVSPVEHVRF